jgi:hypothetical protein
MKVGEYLSLPAPAGKKEEGGKNNRRMEEI